ncbi:MAG: hypothetical protein EOO38_03125 [Cytophagaceae bacterium]|nr:MAG: hypothetical protein EOO38_03125 [Cytophagaceae bacterium]
MDIRESEARLIRSAFERARIKLTEEGFENTETHALYAKTNLDRFVRYDIDWDQYNVLADNRKAFMPVDSLHPNEVIVRRNFGREDLLPERTRWEYTRDTLLPALGLSVGFMGVTLLAHNMIAWIPTAWHAAMNDGHPQRAHASGNVLAGMQNLSVDGAEVFSDEDQYLRDMQDIDEAYEEMQRIREEETQYCTEHPDECQRTIPPGARSFAVAGLVTGIAGKSLFDKVLDDSRHGRR